MIIDLHVHVSALTPGHGSMSDRLLKSVPFRFMRRRLGVQGNDAATERAIAELLARTIEGTEKLDAAVILAFDAVHDKEGRFDEENTHLYITNDYVIELCRGNPKMLLGASVHPYRTDAVAELERCVKAGAVLMKWLPIVQGMNPADERCIPFYEALAHHRLPLLCHTGGERSLPNIDFSLADPLLLEPAIKRGVTVIAAHCGTRSAPGETDFLPQFVRMVHEHEHFYGDTAALNLPTRSYAYSVILKDPVVRGKLVHGSDWPIISIPPATQLGLLSATKLLLGERNWMRRDVLIKEQLGCDDAYWRRAAEVLRVGPRRAPDSAENESSPLNSQGPLA
jgi:predicted TIM-barrel fold metal-dependent hydrolase